MSRRISNVVHTAQDQGNDYRAAGLLMLRVRQAEDGKAVVEVLMQIEDNGGSRRCKFHCPGVSRCREGSACQFLHIDDPAESPDERPMSRLTFLGGKREPHETRAEETATREFCEEIHEMIPRNVVASLVAPGSSHRVCAINAHGSFVLFVADSPPGLERFDLPALYASQPRNPPLACAFEILWVRFEELLRPAQWNARIGYHLNITRAGEKHLVPVPISNLVWSTLKYQGGDMMRAIVHHLTGNLI